MPGYQPLFLKDDITPDELAFIESHRAELPELEIITVHRRLYPRNGFMAHVIGYVGQVSEDMLNQPQWELYNSGDIVGMSGVEQYYNDVLMGKNGSAPGAGQQPRQGSRHPQRRAGDVPGKQLKLTIDLDLQIAAEEALEGKPGAIVAMNPQNGEILAMVSRPAFDPNDFAVHITRDEWNALITDPGKPLLNKAIQAQLAPGSVFKIIMATAGLQEGIAQNLVVNCGGGKTFYGRFFKCWIASTHGSHGTVDISKAIYQSCDSYFYTLAEKLGIGKIAKYATMLGLGQKTGDRSAAGSLRRDAVGGVEDQELQAEVVCGRDHLGRHRPGRRRDHAHSTGARCRRHHQRRRAGAAARRLPRSVPARIQASRRLQRQGPRCRSTKTTGQTITDAMADWSFRRSVPRGSAHFNGIDFAGKTGSAQTISNQLKSKMSAKEKAEFKDNGWFVGVTPRRNPEIVVACLFEGGEHGALAARVAAKVIAAYVAKKRRVQTEVAKANGAGNKQAEVAAVWHEGDAKNPDKLQAGHFTRPPPMAAKAGNGCAGRECKPARSRFRPAALEATESHTEMAQPDAAAALQPARPPSLSAAPHSELPPRKSSEPPPAPTCARPPWPFPRRQP